MQRITPAHSMRILTGIEDDFKYQPHPKPLPEKQGGTLMDLEGVAVVFATCTDCHDCAQHNEGNADEEGDTCIITAGLVDVLDGIHETVSATSEKEADCQDDIAHGCFAPVLMDSVPIVSDFEPLPKPLPSQSLRSLVERDFKADAPLHVPTSGNVPSQALKQPMLPDCPCCGELIVTIGYQVGLVDKRKGHWMVHCVNRDCALYMATCSDIHEAWAMRGKPIIGGAL